MNLLLCIEVEAVCNQDWFITEAHRVLTPGGILVTTILNKASLRAFFHAVASGRDAAKMRSPDYYQVAYSGWRNKLVQSGFKVIHEEGCCWAPFARDSDSLLVPLFVKLEELLGLGHLTTLSPWVVVAAQKS